MSCIAVIIDFSVVVSKSFFSFFLIYLLFVFTKCIIIVNVNISIFSFFF